MADTTPTRVGSYNVIREIGRGGMGVVYLARDDRLDRDVAIKCLPKEFAADEERLARFTREAKILASLNHPNIATIHGLEEVDGRIYLVLEHVDGESLIEFMNRSDRSWRKRLDAAVGISDALASAHDQGVVHRDIKPDNVRFTRDGVVKVLDFGLACAAPMADAPVATATTASFNTKAGAVMGTRGYMSPEQIRGEVPDTRSDIFSFGCLLHEMMTGNKTFVRNTVADTMAATLREDPEPPTSCGSNAPGELDPIVMRCLEKNPKDRFQSASDLGFALRNVISDSSPGSPADPAPVKPRRSRRIMAGCVAVILIAMAAFVYLSTGTESTPITSLAILPFVNASDDPDSAFLCEGIAESIINRMDSVDELRVVSRNASFRHTGREHELDQVARDLGVHGIVTGRITRRGDILTISVTLEDAQQQEQIWGDRFERPLAGILGMEADIADRITGGLQLELSGEQRTRVTNNPTEDPEAYLAYLEGRFWQLKLGKASILRAIELYDRAIEIDESFALAYAGKASAICNLGIGQYGPAAELKPQALAAAQRAVELDGQLAEALLPLGMARWIWDWDYLRAEADLKEAIRMKPNIPLAHHLLAHVLSVQGRYSEAVVSSEEAGRLEPTTPLYHSCLGHFYSWNGQPDLALRQMRDTVNMDVTFGHARAYLGRELVAQGRPDEGVEQLQYLRDNGLRVGDGLGDMGWAYGEAGRYEEARNELATLMERAESEYIPNIAFARINAGLRDDEETLRWLNRAVEAREAVLPLIYNEPHFRRLHNNPRFIEILDRIGITHE